LAYQPTFIVFEGHEGTGKSTLAKLLSTMMGEAGFGNWLTEEPSKDKVGVGAEFTQLIFNKELYKAAPKAALFLFLGYRTYHDTQIRARMDAGQSVISDRYEASTFAYQLAQQVVAHTQMGNLLAACGVKKPDIYIWLKGDIAKCLARAKHADGHHGQYEEAELDFHTRMAEHYDEFFSGWGQVNHLITVDKVHEKPVRDILREIVDQLVRYGIDLRDAWPLNP
jgi:dTMP kinase